MFFAIFSISLFAFSSSSQWIISSEAHDICDGLKDKDEDHAKDDVTIDPSKVMTKCHPTLIWVMK